MGAEDIQIPARYGIKWLINYFVKKPKNVNKKTYFNEKNLSYEDFLQKFKEHADKTIKEGNTEEITSLKNQLTEKQYHNLLREANVSRENTKTLQGLGGKKTIEAAGKVSQATRIEKGLTPIIDKDKQIDAVRQVYDEIFSNAPMVKRKNLITNKIETVYDLRAGDLEYKNVLPILKAKFPKLFDQFDINNTSHSKAFRRSLKNEVNIPSNINRSKGWIQDQLIEKTFRKYLSQQPFRKALIKTPTRGLNVDTLFIKDLFRSRPSEFRTGNLTQDTERFFSFLNDIQYFNPRSETYYRNLDPDFSLYKQFRELQDTLPKDEQLSHMVHTVVPDPFFEQRFASASQVGLDDLVTKQTQNTPIFRSESMSMSDPVPFGGTDPYQLHFLPKDKNINLQGQLENELFRAIRDYYNTGVSRIAAVEQKMINAGIKTKIVDPFAGPDSPLSRNYGAWDRSSSLLTGLKDGGFASIEEVLEY